MASIPFSVNQFISQKLQQLRLKLLDLSLANCLLNFKHLPNSRNFVRVIHDDPKSLWSRIQVNSLVFQPFTRKTASTDAHLFYQTIKIPEVVSLEDQDDLQDFKTKKISKKTPTELTTNNNISQLRQT